jgi:Holliday junction resolvase RusA-like endonuclease
MIQFPVQVTPMGAVRMTQRSKWKDKHAQKYLSYKDSIGYAARQHIPEPLNGPLGVTIAFYYPIPKSWSKRDKSAANDQGIMPAVKPDIDNCIKGVFDALNKVAWNDDNQVVEVKSFKRYSYNPAIVITIQEVSA